MTYPHPGRTLNRYSQCQHHPLHTQLLKGVRFLDLRLHHSRNRFTLHHGITSLHSTFPEVLRTLSDFLTRQGSQETVLVRLAHNNRRDPPGWNGNGREFWQTLLWYIHEQEEGKEFWGAKVWWGEGIPVLAEVRGKVVFVQDFRAPFLLFPLSWRDQSQIVMQDLWRARNAEQVGRKVDAVQRFWDDQERYTGRLAINFLSASGALWTPKRVAGVVYGRLWPRMADGRKGLGVVVGDYMTEAVTTAVVEKNFLPGQPGEALAEALEFERERWSGWNQEVPSSG
jgi:hypothetical protein